MIKYCPYCNWEMKDGQSHRNHMNHCDYIGKGWTKQEREEQTRGYKLGSLTKNLNDNITDNDTGIW